MITLYTFGPAFGLPDPSPFVTKAEMLLKLAGLPYRALVAGKVNKSKNNVTLVTNVIVCALGLPLDQEGQRVEDLYAPADNVQLKAVS